MRQLSGEDWAGVRLRLSTAAAQDWTELPELRSLRIGRVQPRRRVSFRPPPEGGDELFADHGGRVQLASVRHHSDVQGVEDLLR